MLVFFVFDGQLQTVDDFTRSGSKKMGLSH